MRGNTLSLVLVLAGGALAGVAASGCGEPVPLNPTYRQHIQPIMQARCTRCHSPFGFKNPDPELPKDFNPNAGPPFNVLMIGSKGAPSASDFTTYEGIKAYANGNPIMTAYLPYMPPPPSDALGGWELDTLQAWLKNPLP